MNRGLRKVIRNLLPEPWETVLRKEKCLGIFVDMMYDSIPPDKKGRKLTNGKMAYKKGVMFINFAFKNLNIIDCIAGALNKYGSRGIDWNKILISINEKYDNLK